MLILTQARCTGMLYTARITIMFGSLRRGPLTSIAARRLTQLSHKRNQQIHTRSSRQHLTHFGR